MTQANQADLFGEGVLGAPRAPAGRPTTPDGLYYADTGEPTALYWQRVQAITQSGNLTREAAINSGRVQGDGRTFSEAAAGGGYQEGKGFVKAPRHPVMSTPLDGIPGIGNTLGAIVQAPFAVAGEVGKEIWNHPGRTLLTGGANLLPAAADQLVDDVGTGIARDITGDDRAQINAPLTPGQLWDPNGPIYQDSNRQVNIPGIKDIGSALGNALGNIDMGAFFPSGAGAGGGAGVATTPQYTQQNQGALSADAQRIIDQAQQFYQTNSAAAQDYNQQAQQYAQRAAPQMAMPSSARQEAVYDRAMNFQADTSGAQRLEGMQMDMQGVNNLEGFQSTNTQQGVNALYSFRPDETFRSANQLENFRATNTAEGANAVSAFRPELVMEDAHDLRNFQADRSGIDRLNAYADAPEGPSAAQAMLNQQSDADKRTALAIARSGRGGPAAAAQAQRQAISEGAMIGAETRGQAATLRAQETDMYKQRQLQALAQAGSLISQAEAQRLQGMAAAGQLMSQADQQKLQAVMAYGQLKAEQDRQQLSAQQSAGQLNMGAEGMLLNATSNAASLQGQMDNQRLTAISNAANLRTQADQIRSSNLQAAGNIRIQGSGQQLQALSLAGQISSDIRNQDIQVLRSNLDAQLQTLGLNDNQVRFFTQLGNDRELAGQNMVQQANALGLNATQAQQALDLQWAQFGFNQLTTQQQAQFQQQQAQIANARANRQEVYGVAGGLLSGIGSLFGGGGGGSAGGGAASYIPPLPQVPQLNLSMPQYNYTPVSTNNAAAGSYQGAGLSPLQLTMPQIGQGVGYQPTQPQVTF